MDRASLEVVRKHLVLGYWTVPPLEVLCKTLVLGYWTAPVWMWCANL